MINKMINFDDLSHNLPSHDSYDQIGEINPTFYENLEDISSLTSYKSEMMIK